jgi:hypothetical protein
MELDFDEDPFERALQEHEDDEDDVFPETELEPMGDRAAR